MDYFFTSDDLPVATLEQPGITQLNSNLHDIRIDQAATPSGVKAAYELAEAAMTAATANGLTASNNHGYLLGVHDSLGSNLASISNDLYPMASYGSNTATFSSNEVTWLHGAVDALAVVTEATSNSLSSLQGDLGGLSNHLYLDVEPRTDATSNSWFASSNPLFNGVTLLQGAVGLLQAADVAMDASIAWTSNVSQAALSNSQAALGIAAFGSNTALAASNQAFSIGGGGQAQTPDLSFQQLRVTPSNAVTSGTAGIRLGGYLLSNQVIATAGNGDAKVALAVATARRAIESEARPHAVYVHDRLRAFSASAQLVDMSRVIDVGGWSITANAASFRVPRTGTYQLSPYFLTSGAITLRVNGGSAFTLVSGQTSLVVWKANDLLELLATSPTMATVYFELHVAMI